MLFKSLCISLFQWLYSWIKKNTETNLQKSNGHFCRKMPLISRSAFFFAISFGSVYVEKLSSVVLFRVISVGPLSILEWLGLVLLGSFWFSFIFHSICLSGFPSSFLRPIWFSPFDFLLWFCIIPFFRLTFKSFVFIRNIFMAYGVLLYVQCARYKCQCQCQFCRTLMPFNQATDKHVDGIENKCVRATQYNWDFITLTLICVYFVKFV